MTLLHDAKIETHTQVKVKMIVTNNKIIPQWTLPLMWFRLPGGEIGRFLIEGSVTDGIKIVVGQSGTLVTVAPDKQRVRIRGGVRNQGTITFASNDVYLKARKFGNAIFIDPANPDKFVKREPIRRNMPKRNDAPSPRPREPRELVAEFLRVYTALANAGVRIKHRNEPVAFRDLEFFETIERKINE